MGEGPEAVDWAALRHHYGSAADLPELLRACAGDDPEAAEDAVSELSNSFFHDGGRICSAAPAALPFVLRMAADAGLAPDVRDQLLELVGGLAADAPRGGPGVDPGWWPAWERALPQLLALLGDPLPAIRRRASRALRHSDTPGAQLLPGLLAALAAEDDPGLRTDLLLTLGRAARREPAGPHGPEALGLLRTLLADGADLRERHGALLALAPEDPGLPLRHTDLLTAALRAPEAGQWAEPGGLTRAYSRTTALFAAPGPATAFVRALLRDHPDAAHRAAALEQAGGLLAEWRSPTAELLPVLAARLDDPAPGVRGLALDLLACLGPAAVAPHADRIAALLEDDAVADTALWALARAGDPRCAPAGFGSSGQYFGLGVRGHRPALPALHEVLALLPGHAQALMPVVEQQLARDGDRTAAHRFGTVLAGWGAASPTAVERLLDLLAEDLAWAPAAEALARLGPGVLGAAAARAREMLSARMNAPDGGPDAGAGTAAWACWRLGGDPEAAVDALAAHLHRPAALRMLADLGPHAARCAGQLRVRAADRDAWVGVEAAGALWAATGEGGAAVPALLSALRGLDEGRHLPVMPTAVRQLARIGPAARPAVPLLRAALAGDRRLRSNTAWRGFVEDEDLRAAAAGALVAAQG
ncbi:HEAT repeat domain-containing protein [Kitasatospora phosalacinea]|uniref:HEAT repeat domain-containing protein n=1 Tax=Kitasatospora phosalacinea TaxID=2065 RepID=A0A9W6PNQ7_9ACTN|nr:HEAT repeat domain-containing protein [Kitasatospora phosalacinea]GLW58219.1 hypothetical protein Kpho01_62300 [Kitasatospora phosalacinea]